MTRKIVLIIEDSETMIQLYTSLLDKYECLIDVADNTDTALQFMRKKEYDVYIIDVKLKGDSSGIDLIGKGGATPNKCFILSGNLPEKTVSDLIDLYKIPRENIMIKPPDTHKFNELMNKALNSDSGFLIEDNEEIVNIHKVEEKDIDPDELTMDNVHTKLILPYVKIILKNLTFKQWIYIAITLFTLPTVIGPYITSIGFSGHQEFMRSLDNSCEDRFKNFRKGDKVTSKNYIEQNVDADNVSFEIRIYPDNFVSILITSNDNKFEPKKQWIYGPQYIKEKKLDEDVTYLRIVKQFFKIHD